MSAAAILQPLQKSPEKSSGLWDRLKKNLNLKDPGNTLVVQRRNPLDPKQVYPSVGIRRNRSHGDFVPESYMSANGSLQSLGRKNSLKSVQLQLANYDHENNLLNSKPMPKKIISPSQSLNAGIRESNRKELRRAATMASIGREKLTTHGSERSYSTHSSDRLTVSRPSLSPCSAQSRSPIEGMTLRQGQGGKALWGKLRQRYAPTSIALEQEPPVPKLATFTQLWEIILSTVRENEMLELDEPDPRLWWRKMFISLRKKHGKVAASNIAQQLMNHPEMLSAVQSKLAGMVEGNSPNAHMQSLPKSVRRRVKALKKLQYDMVKLESNFYKEVHQLECKYADLYSPLLEERKAIVSGEVEPTDEQCDWPSDDEEDSSLADEAADKLRIEDSEKENDKEDVKGVQGFWLMAFKNVELLASMIQDHDEPILEHLTNVKVDFSAEPMGFTLEFHFSANEYFSDKVLTKSYEMRSEPDEDDPFSFEGPEIIACQGCVINWNKGKNVSVRTVKKKQKHQKSGTTRTVTKQEHQDSFFNFFTPPEAAEVESEEIDEETEALLQADYEIGHYIRERVVPRAVLFFTGEACEEYGDDDEDDDDEDDDDEDFDPAAVNAQGKQECKQQ
ncbi:nucleosome assembly protein 1-like 1 isoform X2 [Watersipora subatra]|uniref:nucleosome assembly protein 1-like 1 isoform X2 n=1 Tax=Watersipora subatra TaxID=2589382 RepID=UPI00355BB6FD